MKKTATFVILAGALLLLTTACEKLSLDLSPDSIVTDGNYWKTPDQFESFITGVHSRTRTYEMNFMMLGELRSDVFGDVPFSGEATQGWERFWYNTLNSENTGVSNYAGLYNNINQINLFLSKTVPATYLSEANRSYYLGQAYGLRAFNYFHLLRTWVKTIITTEPSIKFDINNLSKAASSEQEVMQMIKNDIDSSAKYFGSNYSFKYSDKAFWSKAATLMLKAETYLWSAKQMNGGANDARIANTALNEVKTNLPALGLMANFRDVFNSSSVPANKNNKEVIFVLRNALLEYNMGGGSYASTFLPQSNLIGSYYDSIAGGRISSTNENYSGGLLRAPVRKSTFRQFKDSDSRKLATIKGAYNFAGGVYSLAGCYLVKYPGIMDAGSKKIADDYIVYRYADLLLMLAETKVILGEDPAAEINAVRQRAYGANYSVSTYGFPNQAVDANINEAILRERLLEFAGEGKRWYDLRRFGKEYVFKYTTATADYQLLWPIDKATLTNNKSLVQTSGY